MKHLILFCFRANIVMQTNLDPNKKYIAFDFFYGKHKLNKFGYEVKAFEQMDALEEADWVYSIIKDLEMEIRKYPDEISYVDYEDVIYTEIDSHNPKLLG